MTEVVNQPEWKRRFWATTGSSYLQMILRLVLGVVLFRQLFSGLSQEEFGFWSLLWSLFGYGVLLDFGFGFTAQKAVAEKTAQGDIPGLNRLLATIFWTFIGLSIVLWVAFMLIRGSFLSGVEVAATDRAQFARVYLIFFTGMALMFPLGLFPEILRGLQRVDLANWVGISTTVLHFTAIVVALALDWPFEIIMGISIISSLVPNLFAVYFAVRKLPGLSLSPRLFEWRAVKSQIGFSMAAYLITFSNLLMAKSDQLVIGLTIGVAAVTIYQAGYKMGEMLNMFSIQLQAALSPAAAHLRASGDDLGLQELLLRSSRLTFLVITPAYILSAVYLEGLIRLLTGLEEVPPAAYWVGQALLLAVYSSQLTNSCTKRILMMCGHERSLLGLSLLDAGLNLGVSIALALTVGLVGVAVGTLVPTVLVGWLFIIPLTLRYIHLNAWEYLKANLDGTLAPLGSFAGVVVALVIFAPLPREGEVLGMIWRGTLAGLPWLWFSRKTIKSMTT